MRAVSLAMVAASFTLAATAPRGVETAPVSQLQAQPCTAGLPFAAGSADGQAFAHHFVSKRSVGAWHGTVNLLANGDQSGGDAPARFCTKCWQIFSKSFTLQNAHGGTLAQVDVDILSYGWSLRLLDCRGKLLATVKEEDVFVQRLGLNIKLQIRVSADHTRGLPLYGARGSHKSVAAVLSRRRGCRGLSILLLWQDASNHLVGYTVKSTKLSGKSMVRACWRIIWYYQLYYTRYSRTCSKT